MKTFLIATAVLASWLAVAARAHAATSDADDAASALVAQAASAYDQNELDEALRLLARAYEISPRPSILYNQAQVLRAKNDCVAALDAYQRFIDTTAADDPNRERAVSRRAEMQACAAQRPAAPAGETTPAETPPPAPPPAPEPKLDTLQLAAADPTAASPPPAAVATQSPTAPAEDAGRGRRRAMRVAGWTAVGVGVLAAGASAVFAWQAHSIQEDLNNEIQAGGSPWTPDKQSREAEGQGDATRARWFGAAAAVAAGGGATLLIISRPAPATQGATASATSASTTALIGWSGTF
jgi:tetratricopeptide (TPR) repeat protein